jgi:phosphatidylinositol kinase/protein kinase (PI-3  family)
MITTAGRLVHIDFGFILGRDPKPMQPPFKLSKEMVDAMGGSESRRYHVFKEYCCQAFSILRKSSNLILNLFMLMLDSGITDFVYNLERGVDAEQILLKVTFCILFFFFFRSSFSLNDFCCVDVVLFLIRILSLVCFVVF